MPETPNLTDRLARLRERKNAASLRGRAAQTPPPEKMKAASKRVRKAVMRPNPASGRKERRVAASGFVTAVYSLLFAALLGQLFLIAMLDLL